MQGRLATAGASGQPAGPSTRWGPASVPGSSALSGTFLGAGAVGKLRKRGRCRSAIRPPFAAGAQAQAGTRRQGA